MLNSTCVLPSSSILCLLQSQYLPTIHLGKFFMCSRAAFSLGMEIFDDSTIKSDKCICFDCGTSFIVYLILSQLYCPFVNLPKYQAFVVLVQPENLLILQCYGPGNSRSFRDAIRHGLAFLYLDILLPLFVWLYLYSSLVIVVALHPFIFYMY